ncbi:MULTISPECIES: monovalent cation/H(+) antiporter subunit G [unclassified Halomonas]|uniref:monovalent cation/H(+) antiporter subunit G n=1 Tax=unclassified Halomonas TaxID=2609666 RepID=UPI0020A0DE4B|nr:MULTISPECIES: monovalent cation/H(+) antiporter subunit G [unclassified Halomonas]MCP1313961.1 monovalent cation/H(+) antiporter subunit G [Halomonas sp. 707D7]MCP1325162.1 monovalent cation/H(+) antiporter subunit G [Halomonas sp. 707D4]
MTPELDTLPVWVSLPVTLLLLLGSAIVLIGALGLVKLPHFFQRIHGPAITITLGTGAILVASMIYFSALQSRLVIHEVLITAFIMLTAPVVAMLIMRTAVYRDLRARERGKTPPTAKDGETSEVYPFSTKKPLSTKK